MLAFGLTPASWDGRRVGKAASWDGRRASGSGGTMLIFAADGRREWCAGWTRSTGGADMDRPIWAAMRGGGVYTVEGSNSGISVGWSSGIGGERDVGDNRVGEACSCP